MQKSTISHSLPKSLPETSGVYIFWDKNEKPVYIGKAVNLRTRVRTYFTLPLSTKTKRMINEARYISTISVGSELEALLLEAKLIKDLQPKYNTIFKDDKHPLYIKITKEKYPQVLTARKVEEYAPAGRETLAFFGPFPSSTNVRIVLRMLRRIFPYSDHKIGKRCLRSQIGLCQPCPSLIEKEKDEKLKRNLRRQYLANITLIKGVLSGKIASVKNGLEKKMKRLADTQRFEEAANIRSQIEKLNYITQPITPISRFLKNPNLLEDIRNEELKSLRKIAAAFIDLPKLLTRIECYDVAHLKGLYPTASMVTFIKGEPEKALYRHFRLRQKKTMDDIASMKEVARRRTKYLAIWGVPDLIIVDGGKAQVNAFGRIFAKHKIPIIGLTKRFETLVIPLDEKEGEKFKRVRVRGPALNLVQRIRDEAHRFARRYHHQLLAKSLIPV